MVVIATPTRDIVNAGFAYDLAQLIKHSPDTIFTISKGTILPNQRTQLVREFLPTGASHILFIDSDMRFPHDTIDRLAAHDKDIVAAYCVQKDGKRIFKNGKGLREIDHTGFGVTLIKKEVFMAAPEPWFAIPYDGEKFVGEDIFFSQKAKEAGFKLYVDHDLRVGHEGTREYN